MVIFNKKWKKYNEIQLTKNIMDLNMRKMTNHPPSPVLIYTSWYRQPRWWYFLQFSQFALCSRPSEGWGVRVQSPWRGVTSERWAHSPRSVAQSLMTISVPKALHSRCTVPQALHSTPGAAQSQRRCSVPQALLSPTGAAQSPRRCHWRRRCRGRNT